MLIQNKYIMRANKLSKSFAGVLVFCVILLTSMISIFAQSRISISRVRLDVSIHDYNSRIRPEVVPLVNQAKYHVGNIWKESEFKDSCFDEEIAAIYESPIFIIEVVAEQGYYFLDTEISFKGFDVKLVKTEYLDESEVIYLLCEFGNMSDWGENVQDKQWESAGIASWRAQPGVETYLLKLYNDSGIVGSSYVTKGNRYDFRPLMLVEGYYYYTIQTQVGEVLGEVIASEKYYVDGHRVQAFKDSFEIPADFTQAQLKGVYSGWQQVGNRWWYRNSDGLYEQGNWKMIDNNWYYFDQEGYMVANQWINWKGKDYYLKSDGTL